MILDEEYQQLQQKVQLLAEDSALIIRGGQLIDGISDEPLPNSAVVIKGEQIVWAGSASEMPKRFEQECQVVDASGKTVMPGLMDAHVHYIGDPDANPFRNNVNKNDMLRLFRGARDLARTLNGGFTTVRDLGHGNPDHAQTLKNAVNEGLILGPRILTSRWAISQTGGHGNLRVWPYEWVERYRPRSTFADGPYGVRKAARRNFGEGADLIKIYTTEGSTNVPNFTVEEITAICDEAHTRGARVAAHAKGVEGIRNALLGGVDVIEHGLMEWPDELLDMMAEKGAILVPTYANYYFLAFEGEPWGVQPARAARSRRSFERIPDSLIPVKERGVKIALGTDTGHSGGPGVGNNAKQLEMLVLGGLTPMEALRAGTVVAAEALGIGQYLGIIEEGKIGELLILNHNPLADINRLQDKTTVEQIYKSRRSLSLMEQ